jgi:translation initiation factor IF-2
VVAPKQDTAALEEQLLREQEQEMRRAALESIEDERRWKESIQKAQELKLEEKKQEEQSALDKKLKQMQAKLDSLDFSVEEQSFIDEVNRLSPQLKAVLFADLIKRKTDF